MMLTVSVIQPIDLFAEFDANSLGAALIKPFRRRAIPEFFYLGRRLCRRVTENPRLVGKLLLKSEPTIPASPIEKRTPYFPQTMKQVQVERLPSWCLPH
jgi:hypothetical protein